MSNILLKALALTSTIHYELKNDAKLHTMSSKIAISNDNFLNFLERISKDVVEEKNSGIYTDDFGSFKDGSIFENKTKRFLTIFNYEKETSTLSYKSFIFEPISTHKGPCIRVYKYSYKERINFGENWHVIDTLESDDHLKEDNQLNGLDEDEVAAAIARK